MQRRPLHEDVAVQGVLPLGSLASHLPVIARHAGILVAERRTRTPQHSEAELHTIAHQICVGVVEVLYGNRAPNQLIRCTSERIYNELARRSATEKARRRAAHLRTPNVHLDRVRIQRPNPRAVEVCARLSRDKRTQALAARLEFNQGRWMCVALETRAGGRAR